MSSKALYLVLAISMVVAATLLALFDRGETLAAMFGTAAVGVLGMYAQSRRAEEASNQAREHQRKAEQAMSETQTIRVQNEALRRVVERTQAGT